MADAKIFWGLFVSKIEPKTLHFAVPIGDTGKTHNIALYDWGNSQAAETVFCVHGLTRNGRDFDILAKNLASDYRVLCLDVAGRGKSDWHEDPELYNYPQYVADVAHLIGKLGLIKIHFIGTSMGGIIGMMLANAFPNLLKTLTLNDIGCLVEAAGLKRISAYIGETIFATRAEAEAELCKRCSTYGIADEAHWQNMFNHSIQETEDGKFRFAYDPDIAKSFGDSTKIKDVDLWALWEAVKQVPTLLIRGEKSDILSHETAIKMRDSHPNLTLLEIPNVGHAPALADAIQIATIRKLLQNQ